MAEKTLKSIQFPGLEGRYTVPEGGGGGTVTKESIETALGFAPIGADDVPVKTVNGAVGEVKSTYYVSVVQGNGVFATADKSAQAVYDAYAAGYAVYARVQFQGVAAPFVLPLVAAAKDGNTIKLGFGAIGSISRDNPPQYPTVAYTGEAWAAWLGTLARASDIPSIPASLPNPNALNIKIGDTTTSYDGSEARTVEIPAASRDDLSLGITGAQVGQIAKITAVDTDGNPTAWEAVDMAGVGDHGWQKLTEITLDEDVRSVTISQKDDGEAFAVDELYIYTNATNITDTEGGLMGFGANDKSFSGIGTTSVSSIDFGKNGRVGRNWLYLESVNPLIVLSGTWAETNVSNNKPVYCWQPDIFSKSDNPFAEREKITKINLFCAISTSTFASGSKFIIWGRKK